MNSVNTKVIRILNILRRDEGIFGTMHSVEQFSWILFLNDHFEMSEGIAGRPSLFEDKYRWNSWTKTSRDKELTPEKDICDFVNNALFPYLKSFSHTNEAPGHSPYIIGAIFRGLENRIKSGYILNETIETVDSFDLESKHDFSELSKAYDGLIREMVDAGGYAGEFHTPRPLVRALAKAISPKNNETVYDPAAGTCGFLIEAHKCAQVGRNEQTSQRDLGLNLSGCEITSHAYLLGTLNLIFNGITSPKLLLKNSLDQRLYNYDEARRYDVVITNPPFGNIDSDNQIFEYPIHSKASEILFLQHVMMSLKRRHARAAIVVPDRLLFNSKKEYKKIRSRLLNEFNLHTVLRLPIGTFLPYTSVKASVLFFESNGETENTWFYECKPSKRINKANPLNDQHFVDFLKLYRTKETTRRSWSATREMLLSSFEQAASNPAIQASEANLSPRGNLKALAHANDKFTKAFEELNSLTDLIQKGKNDWELVPLQTLGSLFGGRTPKRSVKEYWGEGTPWITPKDMKAPELNGAELNITDLGLISINGKIVPSDSVLIVARSGILRHSLPVCINRVPSTINQDIKAFVPHEGIVPEYIRYMLLGHEKFILKNIVKSGVTVESLRFDEFKKCLFPIPPHDEQLRIANQLDKCFKQIYELEQGLNQALTSLQALKNSTLTYATNTRQSNNR